jgi:uncharacterized repeat protein (TIGR03803 family)
MTHHYRTTRYLTVPAVAALLLAVSTLAQDAKPVLHTVRGTIERNVRQTFATLHNFCSEGGSTCTDGSGPNAPLIQGADGSLYGTTSYGGPGGVGTIFKITSSGTLTTLHIFCSESDCADGAFPSGGLILANDGNFYGVTVYGGVLGVGTVFKMTPSGTLTTFYNFCSVLYCDDGSAPNGGLIQAPNGNFYGTTTTGGASQPNQIGDGVVYEISPAGKLTTLHSFDGTDGYFPIASLVQYGGSLYGTTFHGGANGSGTLFRLLARPAAVPRF